MNILQNFPIKGTVIRSGLREEAVRGEAHRPTIEEPREI
jgi:hypothetical protein